jgi:hypothetical protein
MLADQFKIMNKNYKYDIKIRGGIFSTDITINDKEFDWNNTTIQDRIVKLVLAEFWNIYKDQDLTFLDILRMLPTDYREHSSCCKTCGKAQEVEQWIL